MSNRNVLSVQLLKSTLIMYYQNKKTVYAQRKELFEKEDLEKTVITMLENIREQADLKNPETTHTYITLPHELVRTSAMMKSPAIDSLKGHKKQQALELYAENSLDLNFENPIYYVDTLNTLEEETKDSYMTVSVVDEEKIDFLPRIFFERKFRLRSIEPEFESVRRYAIDQQAIEAEGNNAIIHFFYDGEEMNVGFYIFNGKFLCGHRYLPLDVYDHSDLKDELTMVVQDCEEKIEGFKISAYCVISERPKDFEEIKEDLTDAEVVYLEEKYATNIGVSLLHERQFKKLERGGRE